MARLRAALWGTEEYWRSRIAAYLAGEHAPRQGLATRVAFVAEEDRKIVGLIAGHLTRRFGCAGELQWIDVAAERQRAGVASELLRWLAAWFGERGARRVCVDVAPNNAGAREFYRRKGAQDLRPSWMVWPDMPATVGTKQGGAMVAFESVFPILRVKSMKRSLEYYLNKLGFKLDFGGPGSFASVSRDQCAICLAEGDQGHPGGWVWIGVQDAAALHQELKAKGAKIANPPTNFPWALEMQVADLDGNILRMGSHPVEGMKYGPWRDMNGVRWEAVGEGWKQWRRVGGKKSKAKRKRKTAKRRRAR